MANSNLEKNQKYCEAIESKIKLDAKPVAMKLIKTEDDLPEGYDLIDEKIRHCEMVRKASLGDVIQVITEPVGGMKLAQSIVYKTGEKIKPSFAGIQSLCGDAFANPYLSKGVNFTLGCDGSRKAADIKDNEMAVGISSEMIDEVISGLDSI